MVTKYPPGLFSKMLPVKADEMSQMGIPITLLHNKILKGGITAKFYIPFNLMYNQKTSILQFKNGQKYTKNTHRLQGGAMKMVP